VDVTLQPTTLGEALAARRDHPGILPIAGGTDLMVELNFDRRRPERMLDLGRVEELAGWTQEDGWLRLGGRLTHARIERELVGQAPALAIAARTVGSPPIRTRGTIGGNLGTSSPAGDLLPPLIACGAEVELASTGGARRVRVEDFCTAPKRNVMAPDELVVAVHVPARRGPQQFAKVGPRNAMVIAVCSFALALDATTRSVGTAIGSAGPTVLRAGSAEAFIAGELDWDGGSELDDAVVDRFGELVAADSRPIDDVRGLAAYRRHALAVLARRTLRWVWSEHGGEAACA
jgi:CO/xanthine dehydrogenase FAD-binding subunit